MVWDHEVGGSNPPTPTNINKEFLMIILNFGKWDNSASGKFLYNRIYVKGYKWTPFCRIQKRWTNERIMEKLNNLENLVRPDKDYYM